MIAKIFSLLGLLMTVSFARKMAVANSEASADVAQYYNYYYGDYYNDYYGDYYDAYFGFYYDNYYGYTYYYDAKDVAEGYYYYYSYYYYYYSYYYYYY